MARSTRSRPSTCAGSPPAEKVESVDSRAKPEKRLAVRPPLGHDLGRVPLGQAAGRERPADARRAGRDRAVSAGARRRRAPAFDAIGSAGSYMVPPDPIMAAGPGHLVAIVNQRYRVWNKSGQPVIDEITMDQFFSGVPHCSGVFDVFVDYDEAANRFVMGGETHRVDDRNRLLPVRRRDGHQRSDGGLVPDVLPLRLAGHRHLARLPAHGGRPRRDLHLGEHVRRRRRLRSHPRSSRSTRTPSTRGSRRPSPRPASARLFFTAQPAKIHGYTSGGWPAPGTPHHYIAHDGGGNSRIWRWSSPFTTAPVIYGTFPEAAFGGIPPSAPELNSLPGELQRHRERPVVRRRVPRRQALGDPQHGVQRRRRQRRELRRLDPGRRLRAVARARAAADRRRLRQHRRLPLLPRRVGRPERQHRHRLHQVQPDDPHAGSGSRGARSATRPERSRPRHCSAPASATTPTAPAAAAAATAGATTAE